MHRGGIQMAHVKKNTRGAVNGLANHFERKTDNHSNEDIDCSRSYLNEDLLQDNSDMVTRFQNRLYEVYCMKREDVKALGTWVVTLPDELKEVDHKQKQAFFEETKTFLEERYGEKNAVAAVVHYDETTPHLHYAFVPVVYDEKKQREKVSAKEVLNRQDLQTFHEQLDSRLKERLPFYERGILNGKTLPLESIEQIKRYGDEIKTIQKDLQEKKEMLKEVSAKIDKVLAPVKIEIQEEKKGILKKDTGNVIVPKKEFEELQEQAQQAVVLSEQNADLKKEVTKWRDTSFSFKAERDFFREKFQSLTKKFHDLKKGYDKLVSKVDFYKEHLRKMSDHLLHYAKRDPKFEYKETSGKQIVEKAERGFEYSFQQELERVQNEEKQKSMGREIER